MKYECTLNPGAKIQHPYSNLNSIGQDLEREKIKILQVLGP
jgi:hypothetical protein